uniref:Transposase n=1 Tax=Heligmosomoides polygyrus TaxID=6339 RepID=A0A183FP26_HELPZ
LIHSITAFCRSEFPQETRRQSESKMPSYRNRFNEREKGIEGRIINATLRDLATKLARIQDQLVQPENMECIAIAIEGYPVLKSHVIPQTFMASSF